MRDRAIADVLGDLGLTGALADRGRAALEAAGVTRPGKQRLAEGKVERARAAVDAVLVRLCRTCAETRAGDGRELAVVPAGSCTYCGGSGNARAMRDLVGAAAAAGVTRLVFVGGSPSFREELARLAGPLDLRLVDGTQRRTSAEARRDVDWADAVVVCGGTELNHKVSNLYTGDERARGKTVVTSRRGIEAIAREVLAHVRRRR